MEHFNPEEMCPLSAKDFIQMKSFIENGPVESRSVRKMLKFFLKNRIQNQPEYEELVECQKEDLYKNNSSKIECLQKEREHLLKNSVLEQILGVKRIKWSEEDIQNPLD